MDIGMKDEWTRSLVATGEAMLVSHDRHILFQTTSMKVLGNIQASQNHYSIECSFLLCPVAHVVENCVHISVFHVQLK